MNGYELVRLQPQQVSKTGDTMTGNLTMSGGAKFVGNLTGNADTATKLQTARTINGTSFNGTANITTANWGTARTITIGSTGKSVNGSGNVSWSLSEIGAAAASHSHSLVTGINDTRSTEYTPSTVRRDFKVTFQNNGTNGVSDGGTYYSLMHIPRWSDNAGGFGSQFAFTDNDNVWYRRGTSDTAWGTWRKIWHSGNFDPNSKANSSHTHNYAGSSSAGGNANAAVKLATARTINGTNFDGTGNITTANWGTARTITIGSTGKSVNGSGNVSWSLSEIGAAATSHTHNYAGSSSAGGAANSAVKLATARTINGVAFDGTANITVPMSGTATSANQLATARTINGTSFNGTANIVTSYWGNARTITIGKAGKSVNGSGNVSWTLAETGAMEFNYTAGVTTPGGTDPVPMMIADSKPWIHTGSGGILPYKNESCYIGHSSQKFYDVNTVHINSLHVGGHANNQRWNIIPVVNSSGVMEVGRYIDMHNSKASTVDYGFRFDNNANGACTYYGTLTQLSDRRVKENISYIDESGIAKYSKDIKEYKFKDFISDMKFATFNYKISGDSTFGFIAQDVEDSEIANYMLRDYTVEPLSGDESTEEEVSYKSFDIMAYASVIAKALQEEIKSRDNEIKELKSKIDSLEEHINSILEAVTK